MRKSATGSAARTAPRRGASAVSTGHPVKHGGQDRPEGGRRSGWLVQRPLGHGLAGEAQMLRLRHAHDGGAVVTVWSRTVRETEDDRTGAALGT